MKQPPYIFIFYDFETQQSLEGDETVNTHKLNLCIAQRVCTRCIDKDIGEVCTGCGEEHEFVFRDHPVEELLKLANEKFPGFKRTICLAHNAKGFDAQFILHYLVEKANQIPEVVLSGSKIVTMDVGSVRFLDSLAYMPMPLSDLPKAFGLPSVTQKGLFPHLFNVPANQDYEGPLPSAAFYSPDNMSVETRVASFDWDNEAVASGTVFNFKTAIEEYCRSDVTILRLACIAFRKIFLQAGGVCPFTESVTIASACSRVFRKKFVPDGEIGIIPPGGYRLADKQSLKAVEWLVWMEHQLGRNILHAARGREYRIREMNRLVDGYYVTEDGSRHVLEFHGCYWHGCLLCHRVNRDKKQLVGECMDKRLEATRAKTRRMRDLGYNVTEMWECEFKRLMADTPELQRYVSEHHLVKSTVNEKLNPRDAFYGGRTGNTSRFREIDPSLGEEIRYVDVCSLYPFICKTGKFPVGHPEVLVGRECGKFTEGERGNINIGKVEGLIKCTVLPPRNLYHPVLPVRMHGKLMFPLCHSCCVNLEQGPCPHDREEDRYLSSTWVSDELKLAVSMGYRVVTVAEIWQFRVTKYDPSRDSGGLFVQYINTFLKIKQEASGWPTGYVESFLKDNQELGSRSAGDIEKAAKQFYIQKYAEREGVQLDISKIEKNPGLRSVSKLCLNSFWGNFGQRDNLSKTTVVDCGTNS